MVKYILKRVAILLITLWVVVTLSFFLMQVMPGTPYNNPKLTDEMIALMNKQYGLDKPVWQQYLTYLWNVLHGDFGTSYQSINQPVSRLISQRLGVSIQLGVQALVIGFIAGILVGAASARNKNNWIDGVLSVIMNIRYFCAFIHYRSFPFSTSWFQMEPFHLLVGEHLHRLSCHHLPRFGRRKTIVHRTMCALPEAIS